MRLCDCCVMCCVYIVPWFDPRAAARASCTMKPPARFEFVEPRFLSLEVSQGDLRVLGSALGRQTKDLRGGKF